MTLARRLLATVLILPLMTTVATAQSPPSKPPVVQPSGSELDATRLSPAALDALISGVALYEDETVQQALAAACDPTSLQRAAGMTAGTFQVNEQQFSPAIRYLWYRQPGLLSQMNEHPSLTARLGHAAQTQLADVWAAVDRVRAKYVEATSRQEPTAAEQSALATSSDSGGSAAYAYPAPAYGAFVTGVVADHVVHELHHHHEGAVYVGPGGGAAYVGSGGGVVYHNGNTTVVNTSTARPATVSGSGDAWADALSIAGRQQTGAAMSQSWGQLTGRSEQDVDQRGNTPSADFDQPGSFNTARPIQTGQGSLGSTDFGLRTQFNTPMINMPTHFRAPNGTLQQAFDSPPNHMQHNFSTPRSRFNTPNPPPGARNPGSRNSGGRSFGGGRRGRR